MEALIFTIIVLTIFWQIYSRTIDYMIKPKKTDLCKQLEKEAKERERKILEELRNKK